MKELTCLKLPRNYSIVVIWLDPDVHITVVHDLVRIDAHRKSGMKVISITIATQQTSMFTSLLHVCAVTADITGTEDASI